MISELPVGGVVQKVKCQEAYGQGVQGLFAVIGEFFSPLLAKEDMVPAGVTMSSSPKSAT